MSEKKTVIQQMLAGEWYMTKDEEFQGNLVDARVKVKKFNESDPTDPVTRDKLLHDLFPNCPKPFYIEPPVHVNFGWNCYFGEGVYINFNCIMDDHGTIRIGDRTLIGPNAGFYGVTHPINYKERATRKVIGKPITIGEDCYIGGSVSFVPGVSVGDRVVIGTGSVVCKDIPSDCVAVGNPCHVIKKLNSLEEVEENDGKYAFS